MNIFFYPLLLRSLDTPYMSILKIFTYDQIRDYQNSFLMKIEGLTLNKTYSISVKHILV